MENELSGEGKVKYPITLDAVTWDGHEYQIVSMVQRNNVDEDVYILVDPQDSDAETIRVKGALFKPAKESKDPGSGKIHRKIAWWRALGRAIELVII